MRKHWLLGWMTIFLVSCSPLTQLGSSTPFTFLTNTPGQTQTAGQIINSGLPAMRFLVSPDANAIALCTEQQAVIWSVNLTSGHRQPISADGGCNTPYAWRPRSQQIFYLRETPAGTLAGAIVSVDANTGQSTSIVPERVTHFALSPDGQYLAYLQTEPSEKETLWVTELTTSRARQVASGQIGQFFWSGDSTHLLYGTVTWQATQSPPTGGYLSTYQVVSGKQKQITPGFQHLGGAVWSPDSQWIALTASKELAQDMQVFVVAADGGQLRSVGAPPSFSFPIAWSPQSGRLLFINRPPGNQTGYGLWQYHLDTGTNTLWAQGDFGDSLYSPDGKKVAVFQRNSRLLVISAEGGPQTNISEKVVEGDFWPAFQWLSTTQLAYLQSGGAIQIQSIP